MKLKIIVAIMIIASLFSFVGCGETPIQNDDCVVKFETFGGDAYEDVTVKKGELLEEPMIPTNGSKYFQGWYKDDKFSKKWNFEKDVVKGNMTIYACFVARYNVDYYYAGERQMRKKVTEGGFATAPDYITASLKVKNWYTNEKLTEKYDFATPVTSDISLYADVEVITSWIFPRDVKLGSGWRIEADTTMRKGTVSEIGDGMLVEFDNPSAWDTYLRSPDLSIPEMEQYSKIVITYKNLSSESNLKFGFFRTTDKAWDGKIENFRILKTNMKETDSYETAVIDISKTSMLKNNWEGVLYILRFEVKKADGDVNEQPEGTRFILGSVALIKV